MTSNSTDDKQTALNIVFDMLANRRPDLAQLQASEILKIYPNNINALFALGKALRQLQNPDKAIASLTKAVAIDHGFDQAHQELGLCFYDLGELDNAKKSLTTATRLNTKLAHSWMLLSEIHQANEDKTEAEQAFQHYLRSSTADPELLEAIEHSKHKRFAKAERACRSYLKREPNNVSAIRLLAEIALQLNVFDDACKLLERCLELAPEFSLARLDYIRALNGQKKPLEALQQINKLSAQEAKKQTTLMLKANCFTQLGDCQNAILIYEKLISADQANARVYTNYGHALKTEGRQQQAIAAYRNAINLKPAMGEAYWSLANLKIFKFDDSDLTAMKHQLETKQTNITDTFHMCFALGKGLEDKKNYKASFKHYALGNKIKKHQEGYSADENHQDIKRQIDFFSTDFFNKTNGFGCQAEDPIFIVGLPRAGSTLLEQIIASHSQVDGTKELPDITAMARRLGARKNGASQFPAILNTITAEQAHDLGQEYLASTQIQRQQAPFFIDKMPNNFAFIGLIHTILPNAKIIDARRHPMDGCFSGFKQLFASGQRFTYGLTDIARYYQDYVAIMDHWDQVLPGKVLRVQYEDVVADLETQARRIMAYCNLELEPNCLNFYQTKRAVRTASSEQVRQPIYKSAVAHWRHYEQDLTELKQALGSVLKRYPID
jgi:tetratricopeptide (TPR) repeat protein